jgi:ADP-ribose pyrophosphatase YjhB (NUDIX family)
MERRYPERPIVGAGAVIVQSRRVVIVQRANEPLKGEWSIPGGAVEIGERVRECAAREALEETGLEVEVGEVLEILDNIYPDAQGRPLYHYVLIDFFCRPRKGELRAGGDAIEARWATAEELDRLGVADSTKRVIRKALERSA